MLINKRKKVQAADTHGGNGGSVTIPKAESNIENNDKADKLYEMEDFTPGNTHTSIKASTKKGKTSVKAETDEQNISTIDNDEDPADGYLPDDGANGPSKSVTAETDEQNISTIDNDEDPADGYLPDDGANGPSKSVTAVTDEQNISTIDNDEDPADGYLPFQGKGGEGDAQPQTLNNNMQDNQDLDLDPLGASLEDGDEDEEGDDEDMDVEEDIDLGDDDDAGTPEFIEDVEDVSEEDDGLDDEIDEEDIVAAEDGMNILDVDGTEDVGDDVAFATIGASVHVIRKNRIIASMTPRIAAASDRSELYLTEKFHEVTAMEIQQKGLRKGLRSMGFELAKVNVAASNVVEERIKKQAQVQASAIRKVQASKEKNMEQALAVASVGVAKGYFKDVENPLMSVLASELQAAGVRNAGRLLRRAFASAGFAFNKNVFALASKIAAMPEEVRAGYVQALDMTADDIEGNPFGSGADEGGDTAMDDVDAFDADEELDDAFINDIEASATTAAFTQPGKRVTASSLNRRGGLVSVEASEVLAGNRAFPFSM